MGRKRRIRIPAELRTSVPPAPEPVGPGVGPQEIVGIGDTCPRCGSIRTERLSDGNPSAEMVSHRRRCKSCLLQYRAAGY